MNNHSDYREDGCLYKENPKRKGDPNAKYF